MEREVSSAVSLATALIAVSLVITLIMYTVYIGNGFKEEVFEEAVQIQTQLSSGQLISMCNGNVKIMPKAAIYSILSQEHTVINSLTYIRKNGAAAATIVMEPSSSGLWKDKKGLLDTEYVYPEDVMSDDLTGKVKVDVVKNNSSTFDIVVEDVKVN